MRTSASTTKPDDSPANLIERRFGRKARGPVYVDRDLLSCRAFLRRSRLEAKARTEGRNDG